MAVFFFDNDISYRVVHALKELVNPEEHQLLALRDKFPANADDLDWIPAAGENNWIVISRDANQRRREAEHKALRANKVRVLYIRQSGNAAALYTDAARIIKNWPKIRDWGIAAKAGTLVKLDTADKIVELSKK